MVEWLDAYDGPQGWLSSAYRPHEVRPFTLGWYDEDAVEDYTTVYSSYYVGESGPVYSNPVHIPNGMVVLIQYLNVE